MEYKSPCRACDHKHQGYVCNWQVHRTGRIQLRPVYSEGLWGLGQALHQHDTDKEGKDVIYKHSLNTYKDETFEYKQEVDCMCQCYVPSDNLEFLEWKYEQSK